MSAPGPCILSTTNIHPDPGFQEVQLWWSAPTTGGAFDSYVISLAGTPVLTVSSTVNTIAMTGLTNAIEYQYSIQAQNSGTSTLGPSVSWRSVQPGNLPAAPSFVSFTRTVAGTATLNISWLGPTPNSNTGSVKWYVLTLIPSSGNSISYPILPSDSSIIISGLNSGLTYRPQLVAINDTGYSAPAGDTVLALLGSQGSQGCAYTYDGFNWYSSASAISIIGVGGNSTFNGVGWNGSFWVAGTQGLQTLVYSRDGINWLPGTSGLFSYCYTISWNGTYWLAGGLGISTRHICYSTNGINWAAVTLNVVTTFVLGIYSSINANLSVAVGGVTVGGVPIAYSTDGLTWTASTNGSSFCTQANTVSYNGSRWVVGTSQTKLIYSDNGMTWTASANGNTIFTTQVNAVTTNGTIWVAGAAGGTNDLGWSDDGITWNASTNGNSFFTIVYSLTWTGTIFLAGGSGANTCAYSVDGKTWSAVTVNPITVTGQCLTSRFTRF